MHVVKTKSKKDSRINAHSNLTIQSCFLINSIIEREVTFENNSDSVVTVIWNERSRAIANDTH
jgi:hypothetical protein